MSFLDDSVVQVCIGVCLVLSIQSFTILGLEALNVLKFKKDKKEEK